MPSANRLRTVEKDELPFLTDVVKKLLPGSMVINGFLSVGFKCKSVDEKRTKIYIPENNYSPFFILITGVIGSPKINSYCIYWKVGTISNSIIRDYLSSLEEVNWTHPFTLPSCGADILNELQNILRHETLCGNMLRRYQLGIAKTYWIENNNDIPVYKLPKNFKLEEIHPDYVEQVLDMWDYTILESVDNIISMIKSLPSSAIFHQTEGINSAKEMVAWALTKHNGEIGMTYTLPKFRGNKLAYIVTSDLVRKHQKLGFLPNAAIADNNPASIKMHKNVGFTIDMSIPIGWDVYQNPNDKIYDAEHET